MCENPLCKMVCEEFIWTVNGMVYAGIVEKLLFKGEECIGEKICRINEKEGT